MVYWDASTADRSRVRTRIVLVLVQKPLPVLVLHGRGVRRWSDMGQSIGVPNRMTFSTMAQIDAMTIHKTELIPIKIRDMHKGQQQHHSKEVIEKFSALSVQKCSHPAENAHFASHQTVRCPRQPTGVYSRRATPADLLSFTRRWKGSKVSEGLQILF